MYPTPDKQERRADFIVHGIGLVLILAAGLALLSQAVAGHGLAVVAAIVVAGLVFHAFRSQK